MVAQRSRACRICKTLTPEKVAIVNATIWPEPGVALRARSYRSDAVRACAAQGLEIEEKSITRHAIHVEKSWHAATPASPAAPGEVPVFPTDYQSVATLGAKLGVVAMRRLEERVPEMEDRELVATARLGMSAATHREALRLKAQEVDTNKGLLSALFGLGGGLLDESDIPEAEIIDVTPVEDLLDAPRLEREALKRLQAGGPAGA